MEKNVWIKSAVNGSTSRLMRYSFSSFCLYCPRSSLPKPIPQGPYSFLLYSHPTPTSRWRATRECPMNSSSSWSSCAAFGRLSTCSIGLWMQRRPSRRSRYHVKLIHLSTACVVSGIHTYPHSASNSCGLHHYFSLLSSNYITMYGIFYHWCLLFVSLHVLCTVHSCCTYGKLSNHC